VTEAFLRPVRAGARAYKDVFSWFLHLNNLP
jgi:hypothetical protein